MIHESTNAFDFFPCLSGVSGKLKMSSENRDQLINLSFEAYHLTDFDIMNFPKIKLKLIWKCIHQIGMSPPVGFSLVLSVVGKYKCSTSDKLKWNINYCLWLHAEPITTIIGGPDLYIDTGSTINLTCIVKHLPEPPPGIYWTHNGEVSLTIALSYWEALWHCFVVLECSLLLLNFPWQPTLIHHVRRLIMIRLVEEWVW